MVVLCLVQSRSVSAHVRMCAERGLDTRLVTRFHTCHDLMRNLVMVLWRILSWSYEESCHGVMENLVMVLRGILSWSYEESCHGPKGNPAQILL